MRGFFVARIVDLVDNKLLLSLKSVIRYLVHKEKVALVALLFHVCIRICKPDSVSLPPAGGAMTIICLASPLPAKSLRFKPYCYGIRPCIRVRILPFHPSVSTRLFPKEPLRFRVERHCSHLYACARWELPTTLLPRQTWGMSGLSSLPV